MVRITGIQQAKRAYNLLDLALKDGNCEGPGVLYTSAPSNFMSLLEFPMTYGSWDPSNRRGWSQVVRVSCLQFCFTLWPLLLAHRVTDDRTFFFIPVHL